MKIYHCIHFFALILTALVTHTVHAALPTKGLLLDLNASKGLKLENVDKVISWANQAPGETARLFIKQDQGRKVKGSGRPTLKKNIKALNGESALIFKQQELVNMEEDAFDHLTTGKGYTWITVMAVDKQRVGVKDVNSFFGNLKNGGKYEGLWGCLNDDNTLWMGERNGLTFGRFDVNNTRLLGPKLEVMKYHVIAGRMQAGTGIVKNELFVDSAKASATGVFPVTKNANPSKMTIGQERDAIEHPGFESFDGEISRFLIYERPLTDEELKEAIKHLALHYGLK
ncbi:MAG: hypothetical protein ACI9E1_001224 [Cryomorphaceae bacterium]|jgi:hypothetical protein